MKIPRVSILFLVFESYEMVRRQVLYLNSLNLSKEFEVIFADDGSNPPVILYDKPNFSYKMVYRERTKSWTIPKIINYAASFAKGVYLMFLGVDHILSPDWVDYALRSNSGYSVFCRKYALINASGNLLKIQYRGYGEDDFSDCFVDYTSLGWVRRNHFVKLEGLNEDLSGPVKGSADVHFFKRWCALRGVGREAIIKRGRNKNPSYYMLPEKKSTVLLKGRVGEYWHSLSHLRPIDYLHKLPERDERVRAACEIPLEMIPEMEDRVRFVHLDGTISGLRFRDFVSWKHPAEIRWMLGNLKK
jgi:hypothetical protein